MSGQPNGFADKVAFIWSVADLLRGDFKAHEYGQVILPFTVLRRLECALAPTKAKVVARAPGLTSGVDAILRRTAGHAFYNVSPLDLTTLLNDPGKVAPNLRTYLAGFTPPPRPAKRGDRLREDGHLLRRMLFLCFWSASDALTTQRDERRRCAQG